MDYLVHRQKDYQLQAKERAIKKEDRMKEGSLRQKNRILGVWREQGSH